MRGNAWQFNLSITLIISQGFGEFAYRGVQKSHGTLDQPPYDAAWFILLVLRRDRLQSLYQRGGPCITWNCILKTDIYHTVQSQSGSATSMLQGGLMTWTIVIYPPCTKMRHSAQDYTQSHPPSEKSQLSTESPYHIVQIYCWILYASSQSTLLSSQYDLSTLY